MVNSATWDIFFKLGRLEKLDRMIRLEAISRLQRIRLPKRLDSMRDIREWRNSEQLETVGESAMTIDTRETRHTLRYFREEVINSK